MADILTAEERSERMSRIRSRGNVGTELAMVRLLRGLAARGWRRHVVLRGVDARGGGRFKVRPDFVFRGVRVALFVDGCFWHACPLHGARPLGNAAFWRGKLRANVARDRRVNSGLRRAGWKVVRVWEHELGRGHAGRLRARLRRLLGGALAGRAEGEAGVSRGEDARLTPGGEAP